jgi:FAD/FMN-containing dehydrogenase
MNARANMPIERPRNIDEVRALLARCGQEGRPITLRGTGCSYGDASIHPSAVCLDMTAMNHVLGFDEVTGVIDLEAGATIQDVWRYALPRGFWPSVVPGTMFPTLGGCAAMNIHGKNHFAAGAIGRYITELDLLTASGSLMQCSRDARPDVFHGAIGSLGLLGVITRLKFQLHRVHSGNVAVTAMGFPTLEATMERMEAESQTADYLVGWVDVLGGGRSLIHRARYLEEGEDPDPQSTLQIKHQELPSRFFLVIPKGWLWMPLWAFFHRPGMRLVNAIKYHMSTRHAASPEHLQSLVGFSFLLDYVPRWKFAYKPHGLIQFQSFVPKATALATFEALIRLSKKAGVEPFLGVLKRHQSEPHFPLGHAMDGFSLALDYPLGRRGLDGIRPLTDALAEAVIAGGGRFYMAKDSVITRSHYERSVPGDERSSFLALKESLDPQGLFRSALAERLLLPVVAS